MRRLFFAVGYGSSFAACALFPSLDELQGDASTDVAVEVVAQDSSPDVIANTDADAAVCGFPIGPTNGLVAYYAFDDGQGLVARDCSPNQLDGTFIRQDVGAWVTGKHGGAVHLGNPTGCIELADSPLLKVASAVTVSAWVDVATYPTGTGVGYVFAKGQTVSNTGYRFGLEASVTLGLKLSRGNGDAGVFTLTGPGPVAGAWHHIAWTFEAGNTAMFLDGVANAVSAVAPAALYDDPTSTLTVGCHPGSTSFPFQGVIDEMRIYDRALTASEITSLAQ